MVESRLAHSASRSGANNVELSPVGDYRRGDCLIHPKFTLIPFLFVTLILNPSCWTFTSSIPKSSHPTGGAGVPQPGLRRRQHGSDPHTAHACREDLHLQLQATAAGGGQGCSHSCRDAPGATPSHHRERLGKRHHSHEEQKRKKKKINMFFKNPTPGHFGTVYHGYFTDHNNREIHCAVKSLNSE